MDYFQHLTHIELGAAVTVASLVRIVLAIKFLFRSKGPIPPGPPGLPFVGNIFQLPAKGQYLKFTEWKEKYGPIFSLNLMGQLVVVLNTHQVAADLLDRRSLSHSDRPRFIRQQRWRRLRRAAHEGLNIRAAEKLQPQQKREAATLAAYIIRDPDEWEEHLKRYDFPLQVVRHWCAVYALPSIPSNDDPLVTRINEHMHRTVDAGQPGNYLVEVFPIMKLISSWMAKWKRDALHWHREDTKMFEELLEPVQKAVRIPTFADQANLPYIRALVKETLRWRAPGPLGLPRRAHKDDFYEGYFIPKGTVVIDPEIFTDPDQFQPERFLDSTGTIDIVPTDTHGHGHVSFGFGRRICVGLSVANQSLFIDMAYLVWALNIRKAKDSDGNPITPSRTDEIEDGLVVRPVPFTCNITSHGENTVSLLEAAQLS
ncbi:cytochrome P450 [Mycena olivaceomarginata]|nr:cytochrome P450 [Mycena olivaceomarginata]